MVSKQCPPLLAIPMIWNHLDWYGRVGASCNSFTFEPSWWSGYCYLNKGECNLNQSKDDSFVERVAKNNSWNNGDRHKIHEIFLISCFVFIITLVWKTVHSSAMTQIKAHLMEKTMQLTVPTCSQATVPVLAGWTLRYLGTFFTQITKL